MHFLIQLFIGFLLISSCKENEAKDANTSSGNGKLISFNMSYFKDHHSHEDGKKYLKDKYGNQYIAGTYNTPVFKMEEHALINPNKTGKGTSIYLAKIDSSGKEVWANTCGGDSYDNVNDMHLTSMGDLIVTGDFRSLIFNLSGNIVASKGLSDFLTLKNRNGIERSNGDMFVAKYDALGNLKWAKSAGGKESDIGWTCTSDSLGRITVEGTSLSDTTFFGNVFIVKNGPTYESLNFSVVYDGDGNLLSVVDRDAGYKTLQSKFEEHFYKCLNDFKIKISCSGSCDGVAVELKLSIDSEGNLKTMDIIKTMLCKDDNAKEKFKNKLLEFLKTYKYPSDLRGKEFEINVSRVLKC